MKTQTKGVAKRLVRSQFREVVEVERKDAEGFSVARLLDDGCNGSAQVWRGDVPAIDPRQCGTKCLRHNGLADD